MRELEEILSDIRLLPEEHISEETMTDGQKERILEKTMQKIDEGEKNMKKEKSDIKPIPIKKTAIRVWQRVAVIVLAVILIPGTAVYAAYKLHWDEKIAAFFGRSENEDSEVSGSIQEVNKSAEVDGITATLTQVLGDESGFYAMLRISGVSEEMNDQIQYQPVSFREYNLNINGENVGKSGLIDMGTDYETGEYCYMIKVNTTDLMHAKAELSLVDFGIVTEDSFETLCSGEWIIDWTLDYGNVAVDYQIGKNIQIDGHFFTWDSVSVSPISVIVKVSSADETVTELPDIRKSFYVDFSDGSRLDAQYVSDAGFYQEADMAVISFDRIHQPEDVVSVTFAGETYLINEEKLQEKVPYENEEMGFSLQMSKELFEITDVVTTDYHDDDFGADGKKAVFTMTKNGVSMDAFTICEIDGTFTREDADEYNPMANYLLTRNGKTYLFIYGEFMTEDQINEFSDILNRDVAPMLYFFQLTEEAM